MKSGNTTWQTLIVRGCTGRCRRLQEHQIALAPLDLLACCSSGLQIVSHHLLRVVINVFSCVRGPLKDCLGESVNVQTLVLSPYLPVPHSSYSTIIKEPKIYILINLSPI